MHQTNSNLNQTLGTLVEQVQQNQPFKIQIEVLKLPSQGNNNLEIAQALRLTEGAGKNHITRILGQLRVRDRTQAAL